MADKKKRKKPAVTKTSFIILIGGPGTFEACDKEHDQVWSNYIVPIQVASKEAQLSLAAGEQAHWWAYAPAYRERWADDVADVADKNLPTGPNLLESRRKAIDKVKAQGASSYLDRIEKFAGTVNAQFKAIETPADFWKELDKLPAGSVSRVWYIGHARNDAFMLKLIHADVGRQKCMPAANPGDMITVGDISANAGILKKVLAKTGTPSKFYGCFTKDFAEQWNTLFGTPAEGATSRIDFSLIDKPSDLKVLPRLQDKAGWQSFPAP